MGTGTETRASKYLAELAGEMYGEIHPNLAAKYGIKDNEMMWVHGTDGRKIKIKCKYGYTVDEIQCSYLKTSQEFGVVKI